MLAVVGALVIGGCGSTRTGTGISGAQTAAVTTYSVSSPTTNPVGPHQYLLEPLSGGTECVVSYDGAFVVFKSSSYDVTPACKAQIRAGATDGQHWIYPTGAQVSGNTPVCTLSTATAMATIYDTADNIGQGVCAGLISAGWSQA
jgi:hypothetical protein